MLETVPQIIQVANDRMLTAASCSILLNTSLCLQTNMRSITLQQ